MRTTVTLEPDVDQLVKRLMRERGMSFKEAVNHAIRVGAGGGPTDTGFRTQTFAMGPASVPLEKALQLAGELEDEVIARRLAARK